jgi:hypothetical protein
VHPNGPLCCVDQNGTLVSLDITLGGGPFSLTLYWRRRLRELAMESLVARRALCSLAIVLALALATAAQAPQFRSGTDIVTVDVTVLDRSGAPATRLNADDFTLTVDGRPRRIQSVRLVKTEGVVPSPGEPPAA